MTKLMQWGSILLIACVLISLVFIVYSLVLIVYQYVTVTPELPNNVVVALVGAIAATITIVGSFTVALLTSAATAKQQRNAESRKIKQEYYNVFLESMSKKLSYTNNQTSDDAIKVNQEFCTEVNRLPLYASQRVVEHVANLASGGPDNRDFSLLYSLIREDLCNDNYEKFKKLSGFPFQIPNR